MSLDTALYYTELAQQRRKLFARWMKTSPIMEARQYEAYRSLVSALARVMEVEAEKLDVDDIIEHWDVPGLRVASKVEVPGADKDPTGPRWEVVATEDGIVARRHSWIPDDHRCSPGAKELYYEVLSGPAAGHHGWICSECRAVSQTG